ncbi:RICIN domain-containing protein [Spirillospora sp. CA-253888]
MANATPPVFYITSSWTDDSSKTYVLAVQGADKDPGTPVVLWLQEITDAQSQLWSMTADGHILSQLNGCVLAYDSAKGQLVTQSAGDSGYPLQLWSVTEDGYIESQENGDVLTPRLSHYGVVLAARGSANQQWSLVAPPSPPKTTKWVRFQSALQDADGNACLLDVQGGSEAPGTQVIVWPGSGGRNELWQITADGRILSAQGNNLVLTVGKPVGGIGPYHLTVDTQQYPVPEEQTWEFLSYPSGGQIIFSEPAGAVIPSANTGGSTILQDGDPILVEGGVSYPGTARYTAPSSSLNEIMAQPQTPFQEFTGGQANAYEALLAKLQITSLRAEYYNLETTLSDYGSQIAFWPQAPSGVTQEDWDTVRDQLLLEIRYANTTRNLFENYQSFHLALFVDNGALLNKAIADAALTQGENPPNVGGIVLSVFEGLAYTALEAAPGAGPVLGNLMEAGINIALAAESGAGSISPDPFQVAVSELWGQLSDTFDALLISMGNMEITILQDWGKLQSVYQLTRPQKGGDSLYWDPNTTAQLVDAARRGYMISVMQMLLPARYQIYSTPTDYFPDGCPDSAKWQSGGMNYWIASNENYEEYPDEWTMQNDIWGNGVRQDDFFLSSAGWGFPAADTGLSSLTFANLTPNMLELACSEAQIDVKVAPYQRTVVNLGVSDTKTFTFNFQVTDLNNPQGKIPPFTVQTWMPFLRFPRISITTPSAGFGYQFTSAICNPGGGESYGGYAAAGQFGIMQA